MELRKIIAHAAAIAFAAGAARADKSAKPPDPVRVDLVAADSIKIAGFWLDCYEEGAPAALLIHDLGRDHTGWRPLWPYLQRAGYHVLALDLRGHGASRALAPQKYELLLQRNPAVYREMVLDAEAGLQFLERTKHVRPERIVVLGGEIGCAIGFTLMQRHPRLAAMAALGPAEIDPGFQTLDLATKYGSRPLLVLSTKSMLARGPQAIADALRDRATVQLEVWPGGDVRGVFMLEQPAVDRVILEWMRKTVPPGG